MVATEHAGVDVDMNEAAWWLEPVARRRHFAEPASDGEGSVAFPRDLAHERRRGIAKARPEKKRMALRHHTLALIARGGGCLQPLDELHNAGMRGAEPDIHERALGPIENSRRLRRVHFDDCRRGNERHLLAHVV